MKKVLIGGAVILAFLIGSFFALNAYIYNEKQSETPRGEVKGVVTGIDLEPMTYDGNGRITITTEVGKEYIIKIPARGFSLCAASPNVTDAYAVALGDYAEVVGDVTEDGSIVACASLEHSFRVTGKYSDSVLGFAFEYRKGPNGYVLQSPPHGNEEEADFEEAFILMMKSDYDAMQIAEGTEGPPTISVLVYRNSKKQTARVWAEANAATSNFNLKLDEPKVAVVGGEKGVRYMVDGLYRMDTLVIAHGDFMYLISGAYLEEDSLIREDFKAFLQTLTFIPSAS